MRCPRTFWTWLMATAMSFTSISAGTLGDNPVHDLVVIESPPTFGSCEGPVSVVSGPRLSRQGGEFTVLNKSVTASHDVVIFDVVVDGKKRQFWVSLDLPPRSSATYTVQFLTIVESPDSRSCRNRPGGIVESPDPILAVVGTEPTEF